MKHHNEADAEPRAVAAGGDQLMKTYSWHYRLLPGLSLAGLRKNMFGKFTFEKLNFEKYTVNPTYKSLYFQKSIFKNEDDHCYQDSLDCFDGDHWPNHLLSISR